MKKLLLILLCLPLLFNYCSKGNVSPSSQTLEEVIIGKRWKLKNATDGFYLHSEGTFYLTEVCQSDDFLGEWIIDNSDSTLKYIYYQNSLEITEVFGTIVSFSETEIKFDVSTDPTTQINVIYEVTSEDV